MELSVPIENQEIPQTGFFEELEKTKREAIRLRNVKLYYDPKNKKMCAKWNRLHNSHSYCYQFYTSPINPDNTVIKTNTLKKKCETVLGGLPSGQRVLLRVRANTKSGIGPWSEPVEKRVP